MANAHTKPKVLILGATGMLGHQAVQTLENTFEVWATARKSASELERYRIFDTRRILAGIDAMNLDAIDRAIEDVQPYAVVNCIGIVKQHPLAKDTVASLTINSLLPHRAARASERIGAKFIHVSTDCVFDGKKGNYNEFDIPNAEDLYGRSKWMGEVADHGALTLRTSIIGPELDSQSGLLEWFLSGHRQVKGYTHAVFSGLTTFELCRVIARVIVEKPELTGLYQVAAEPINKFDLISLINDFFDLGIEIVADSEMRINRSLDGRRFREALDYVAPSWPEMIQEIAKAHALRNERKAYVLAG